MAKCSQIGRNKKSCQRYESEGRRETNKAKKQAKHLKRLEYFTKRREVSKCI